MCYAVVQGLSAKYLVEIRDRVKDDLLPFTEVVKITVTGMRYHLRVIALWDKHENVVGGCEPGGTLYPGYLLERKKLLDINDNLQPLIDRYLINLL